MRIWERRHEISIAARPATNARMRKTSAAAWRMTALADEPPESTSRCRGAASGGRIAVMRERMERNCDSRIARGCAAAGMSDSCMEAGSEEEEEDAEGEEEEG